MLAFRFVSNCVLVVFVAFRLMSVVVGVVVVLILLVYVWCFEFVFLPTWCLVFAW